MKINKLSDIGVSCYRPLHVYNKYVGRTLTVPCRECEACLKGKSSRLVSRIESLRSRSSMSLFVTFTYDNDHVPVAVFRQSSVSVSYYSLKHHRRMFDDISLPKHFYYNMKDIDWEILRKGAPSTIDNASFPPFSFSVLRKRDVQLFFMRFRKLFRYAFPEKTFKYFVVGEYGSRTFRAHYHALIFFPDTLPFAKLQDICRLSWKFGFIDVQAVSSSAASYCASYLSSVGVLPYFLQHAKAFKPFHTQSNGTVFELFKKDEDAFLKEVYFKRPYFLPQKCKDGYVLRPLSSSLRVHFYPICTGFYNMSRSEQRTRLRLFATAIEEQRCKPCDVVFSAYCKDVDGKNFLLSFPFSVSFDLRKKFDDVSKKSDFVLCNRDFVDIYNSKRIYDLSKRLCVSVDFLIDYIIDFYVGSSYILPTAMYTGTDGRDLPSSNFQLSLLRSQFSAFECAENDDDLRFLYSFFDGKNVVDTFDTISSVELDAHFASKYSFSSALQQVKYVVDLTCPSAIKHKDRNSYYQLLNK